MSATPTPEDQAQLEKLQAFVRPYLPAQATEAIEFMGGGGDEEDDEVWAITYEEPSPSGVTLMLFVKRRQADWSWDWHLSGGESDRWGVSDSDDLTVTPERLADVLDALGRGSVVVARGKTGTTVSLLGADGKAVREHTQPSRGGFLKAIGIGKDETVTYRHWRAGP